MLPVSGARQLSRKHWASHYPRCGNTKALRPFISKALLNCLIALMTIDPTGGLLIGPEGDGYIAGIAPPEIKTGMH